MTDVKFEKIELDYEGIAKVLMAFAELYKHCDNKEILDDALKRFTEPHLIVK